MIDANKVEPPRWLWLWFPVLVLILEIAAFSQTFYYFDWFYTEAGLVELLTPVASTLGVITGIAILRHPNRLRSGLRVWVALVTFACFYTAGEEISWGQYVFGWPTPEWMMQINDHYQTNLHNTSSWFNEKPRMLLELYVLGGIIHVLWQRGGVKKGWQGWFWPTYVCLPIALLAILMQAPDRLQAWFGMGMPFYRGGWSELEELYLAMFLFLYLLSIWYRLGMDLGRAPPRDRQAVVRPIPLAGVNGSAGFLRGKSGSRRVIGPRTTSPLRFSCRH
jgi:hypothetical protein